MPEMVKQIPVLGKMNQGNNPLVSIIIPTYNRANLLPICIRSCLDQTYKNIEIIVVDDGSIDNTAEVVTKFNEKDSRIILVKKENGGLSSALNYGFKFAKGSYLTWTSDDNYYSKDAINSMLMFLQQHNCSLVYCDYFRFKKDSPSIIRRISCPDIDTLKQDNCIGPCFLYTRKIMEVIGAYDPETKLAEDYDFWIRVAKKFSICHLKETLYYYMEHSTSLSLQFYKTYEIELVSTLVKFKNNIIDTQKTVDFFIVFHLKKFFTEKSKLRPPKGLFFRLISIKKVSYLNKSWIPNRILKALIKYMYYKKVLVILRAYKTKELNFSETKLAIKNIF